MHSPASTIDSPIVSAVRATNLPDSDEEFEQTFVGSCVTVKLGILTLFGTITSC